jgi:aminoglycoside phosphotransferase
MLRGRDPGSAAGRSDRAKRGPDVANPVPNSAAATVAEPFNEATARLALEDACTSVRLSARGAELVRLGENAVFRLQVEAVVARVGRSAAKLALAERQLSAAHWLSANDVPAIRPLDVTQPVIARGRVITFWESASDDIRYGSTRDLGHILRRLHQLPIPLSVGLPRLTPFETARARIAAVPIAETDRQFLAERCDALGAAFASLPFTPGDVVLHGDANVGNLILDRHDRPLLSDLDSFCVGPREWDLVLTAMFYKRFGWHSAQEYADFVDTYGYDVLHWAGFDVLADLRELLMVAWLAQNARDDEVADELAKRLNTMRSSEPRTQWSPF